MKLPIATIENALEYLLAPASLINETGALVFANQAFANLIKMPRSQMLGTAITTLLQSEGENLEDLLAKVRTNKTPFSSCAVELVGDCKSRVVLTRLIRIAEDMILVSLQEMARETENTTATASALETATVDLPPPPTANLSAPPPPPPAETTRWRLEAKQWEQRHSDIAARLAEQADALHQANETAKTLQLAAAQMTLITPSFEIETAAVLEYLATCVNDSERLATLRQYLKDCILLLTKMRTISRAESSNQFSLLQLNIATLKGFTDDLGAAFLTPLIAGVEANMKARRQNIKDNRKFLSDLDYDLQRLARIAHAMQRIIGGDLSKSSDDPHVQWQEYLASFRSELQQHCHHMGKPVNLVFKSSHALVGKDLEFFDRIAKALISRAVNHGIEPPALRSAAGKKETGQVLVNVERRGSFYIVNVADDGTGIGLEALYRRGLEWGLLEKKDVPMDPDNIVSFLLIPKILAEAGSRISHLPAIKSEIETHGGFLRLERSSDKKGTKFVFDWLALEQSEHVIEESPAA